MATPKRDGTQRGAMSPGLPGLAETKSAMQELLTELEQTRKEYAKSSLQLTQQETLINHLKDADAKKDAVIAHLEDELRNGEQIHLQETGVLQEESKTAQLEMEHKIRYLELEVARLQEENNIYSRFEKENRDIRQTVLQQQEQIERLQNLNDDLKTKAKDDLSDFRSQLEDEFKRRLSESEKQFQLDAYRSLSEEAKIALQGNEHLQTVLQRQNESIEGVVARCKKLETSHSRMKIEQELSQQNLQLHQQEVQKLRKQLTDSKTRCSQLEESLKSRRIERASLELLYMEYETTRKDLVKTQEKFRRSQREAERWKQRTVQLQQDVTTLAKAVPPGAANLVNSTRLAQVQQATADMSASLRRSRKPKVDVSGKTGSSSEEEWSDDADDSGIVRRRGVDPVEILSMWNVNFENWRNPEEEEAAATAGTTASTTMNMSGGGAAASPSPGAGPPRPPPQQRQRGKRRPGQPTTDDARQAKDRDLSVLSRKKLKSLPPYFGAQAAPTGVKPANHHPFSVVDGGTVPYNVKQQAGHRFLVP